VSVVRPKVAELVFSLYGRALHPELFKVYQTRTFERNGYRAKVDITSAGHVVTWQYMGQILTEVAAAANHPLPKTRELMSHRLRSIHRDRVDFRGVTNYKVLFQLEHTSLDIFWACQQELSKDEHHEGLVHLFDASGRVALGAVSYVHVTARNRSLLVRAFHTFPDDCAIVKSESLFELPSST
jgi:hypothetical protein